jgi:uncharacterized membrane protein YeaQ/YmgE (transglycosylase-associated protein family)
MPSINQIVVWIIIGLLGGSLAGLIITRERKGFGILRNLGVGLVGALVGGLVFRLFGIFPGTRQNCHFAARCRCGAYRIIACPRTDLAMAALPEVRVITTPPFAHVSLDQCAIAPAKEAAIRAARSSAFSERVPTLLPG